MKSPAAILLLLAPLASAQSHRIPIPLAPATGGDAHSFLLTPDGTRVVYLSDQDEDEDFGWYVVAADGQGEPRRIFDLPGSNASGIGVTNERFVMGVNGTLWSVPLDPALPAAPLSSSPGTVQILPDGRVLVFQSSFSVTHLGLALYAIDGSGSTELDVSAVQGQYSQMRVSPDGRYAVLVDETPSPLAAVFDLESGLFVGEYGLMAPPAVTGRILLDPSSTRIVVDRRISSSRSEFYRIALDASVPPILLFDSPIFASVGFSWKFSSDGQRVVFTSDRETDDQHELWSVRLDGSAPVKLSGTLPPGADVQSFEIVGPRAVYEADGAFLSVPVDASEAPTLLEVLPPGQVLERLVGTPDGTTVVGTRRSSSGRQLSAWPVAGGPSTMLFDEPGLTPDDVLVSPDGAHIVFDAGTSSLSIRQLYSAPIDGGHPAVALTDRTTPGGASRQVGWTPDGAAVLFTGDDLVDLVTEIFRAPADGDGPTVRLSGDLPIGPPGGDVETFQLTRDGRLVYRADVDEIEDFDLFVLDLRQGSPRKLSTDLGPDDDVALVPFTLAPDEQRVVYRATGDVGDFLYSARLDGVGDPVQLGPYGAIELVSGDSAHVLFRDTFLRSAPIGGGPTSTLPVPAGATDSAFLTASDDGLTIVYRADLADSRELWIGPVDGSGGLALASGLVPGSDSIEAAFGAGRLVYRAEHFQTDTVELYSVPLDASAPPIRLHPEITSGGEVRSFRPSPDGTRVLYTATSESRFRPDLFVVPVDGSASPLRLSGTPGGPGTDLWGIVPEQPLVVFVADSDDPDNLRELRVVPLDGSTPAVSVFSLGSIEVQRELFLTSSRAVLFVSSSSGLRWVSIDLVGATPPVVLFSLPGSGETSASRLTPDGGHLLVVGSPDPPFELFAVPLDGSRPPRRLNGPLVPNGNVSGARIGDSFFSIPTVLEVDPASSYVIYPADEIADGVTELFLAPLGRLLAHPAPSRVVLR